MVDAPTQREPLDNKILPLALRTDNPPISILRMSIRHRVKHHHTPQKAGRSGRTSKATAPSGTVAEDAFSSCRPLFAALKTSSPNGRSSEVARGPLGTDPRVSEPLDQQVSGAN
eukprot:3030999-Pleurochrysis_carterae.AAC.1